VWNLKTTKEKKQMKKNIRIVLVLVVILAIVLGIIPVQGQEPEWQDKIDPQILQWAKETRTELGVGAGKKTLMILFDEKTAPDLSPTKGMINRKAKGEWMAQNLTQHAQWRKGLLEKAGLGQIECSVGGYLVCHAEIDLRGNQLRAAAELNEIAQIIPVEIWFAPPPQAEEIPTSEAKTQTAYSWNLTMTHVDEVHAMGYQGQGVTVAAIDTGVDADHPEFDRTERMAGWFDATSGQANPYDISGHGTHVLAVAVGNSVGVAPQSEWLMANACVAANFCYSYDILEAADWVLSQQPEVVNISLGSSGTSTWFESMKQALHAADIYTVGSVGNNGPWCSSGSNPANLPGFTSVGALQSNGYIASWSSRGQAWGWPQPSITAPGVNIRSAWPGGGYSYQSGTSAAAPHIAGIVALMRDACPSCNRNQIRSALLNAAEYVGDGQCGIWQAGRVDQVYGWGRANALSAVQAVAPPPGVLTGLVTRSTDEQPISGATIQAVSGKIEMTTTSETDGQYSFTLIPEDWGVSATAYSYHPSSVETITVVSGVTTTLDIKLVPKNTYKISGVVYTEQGDPPSWQPQEGVKVEILSGSPDPPPDLPWEQVTGSDGKYTFSGLLAGIYDLQAKWGVPKVVSTTVPPDASQDFYFEKLTVYLPVIFKDNTEPPHEPPCDEPPWPGDDD
jgi:hypothetical protein